jgi:hypothetical protein
LLVDVPFNIFGVDLVSMHAIEGDLESTVPVIIVLVGRDQGEWVSDGVGGELGVPLDD